MPSRDIAQALALVEKWERENPQDARLLVPVLGTLKAYLLNLYEHVTVGKFDELSSGTRH